MKIKVKIKNTVMEIKKNSGDGHNSQLNGGKREAVS